MKLSDNAKKDLVQNYNQVRKELKEYSAKLTKKEEIIVLNKIDLIDKKILSNKIHEFQNKVKKKVLMLSTLDKVSIKSIKASLLKYVS